MLNIPPDKRGLICEKDATNLKLWSQAINEIFKENLLTNASYKTNLNAAESFDNLFSNDESTVLLEKNSVLEFSFSSPQKINCIRLEEDIAFGQRINCFTVEYLIDGKWSSISNGKCVGNCFARHFDTVTAEAIRITLDSDETPVLKFMGAFYADESFFVESFESNKEIVDLTTIKSARIINNKTEIEIEFGGIFPFNTVIIDDEKLPYFEIFAFNGSQYESVYFGVDSSSHEVCKFKEIEGSYKIKVVSYDCDGFNHNAKISVFKR